MAHEELKDAIARLTHEEQHIFYRKYYYLQRTAQITAELGMTERFVEGKLYRLYFNHLKLELREYMPLNTNEARQHLLDMGFSADALQYLNDQDVEMLKGAQNIEVFDKLLNTKHILSSRTRLIKSS